MIFHHQSTNSLTRSAISPKERCGLRGAARRGVACTARDRPRRRPFFIHIAVAVSALLPPFVPPHCFYVFLVAHVAEQRVEGTGFSDGRDNYPPFSTVCRRVQRFPFLCQCPHVNREHNLCHALSASPAHLICGLIAH